MSFEMQKPEKKSDQVVLLIDQPPVVKSKPEIETKDDSFVPTCEGKHPIPSTLRRLNFSKPKSRFVEFNYPRYLKPEDPYETVKFPERNSVLTDEDDDEDILEQEYEGDDSGGAATKRRRRRKKRSIRWGVLIEWVSFSVIMTALICSLTVDGIKHRRKYGIQIWKWCLMMMGIICGHLVSGWIVRVLVFLIERNFMLREKVLYFVYGLRKSVQNQLWLGLVLQAWSVLYGQDEVQRHHKILKAVFDVLIATLIGVTIWLAKSLLVKILASSFHATTFFDRMKESVFHHYILETLSGGPIDNETERELQRHRNLGLSKSMPATLRHLKKSMKRTESWKIDMDKLRKLSMESTPSAWSVKRLMNNIKSSGLSTISKTVHDFGKAGSEITSEWEARSCALRIFKNVAKPSAKYIEEDDLLKFLTREEVHTIFHFFEGALETGQIRKSAFRNWMVRAYHERKFLCHSLNDTKTAVQQLHRLASAFVMVIIVVVFLMVMGFATSKVLVVVTTPLLLAGFMFQNTCKNVFESIIFVFVMHPFDVGDRCVIDGVQMIVEEMNILTTVFLRYDNEKIFYPNSILSTKPISNFYRSPEMGDGIDFTIDVSTSEESFNALKNHIQAYIDSKPEYWNPNHSVIVKDIENVDKMMICLGVLHTMNHQDFSEKTTRRSELVFELKKILEKLDIKYRVLPQEVHLTRVVTANGRMLA